MLANLKSKKIAITVFLMNLGGFFLAPTLSFANSSAQQTKELLEKAKSEAEANPVAMPEQILKLAIAVVRVIKWSSLVLGVIFVVKICLALYKGMMLDDREFRQVKKDLGKDFMLLLISFGIFGILFTILAFMS